jgi:hypothetical protein
MNSLKIFNCVIFLAFCACHADDNNVVLDLNADSTFRGTFNTVNSDIASGDVVLIISNGSYQCTTSEPFGRGAGLLSIDDKKINFIDTLFFPIPAIYGPPNVLSGEHNYRFNGEKLILWKSKNVGEIEYELQLDN